LFIYGKGAIGAPDGRWPEVAWARYRRAVQDFTGKIGR